MNKIYVVLLLILVRTGLGMPAGQFVVDGLVVDAGDEKEYKEDSKAPAEVFEPFTHWKQKPVGRSAPVAVPVQKKNTELQQLQSALSRQKYDKALILCRTLLIRNPDNLKVLRTAATVAAAVGSYSESSRYFQHLIELDRNATHYRAAWTGVLMRLGKWEQACEQARQVRQAEPDSMEAVFTLTAASVLEDRDTAYAEWWRERSLPELFRVVNWLHADAENLLLCMSRDQYIRLCDVVAGSESAGYLMPIIENLKQLEASMQGGHWDEALKSVESLKQQHVNLYSLSVQEAQCLFETGQPDEAASVLTALSAQQPDNGEVWFNLGFIYLRSGRYNQARVPFARAAKRLDDSRLSIFGLACAYAGLGNMDKAYAALQTLTPRAPRDLTSWLEGDRPYLVAIREDPRYQDWFAGLHFVEY